MENIIALPKKEWNKVKALVAEASRPEYITEPEAATLLGISIKTLKNYVSNGRISRDMYKIGVGNNRFYNKEKLMGK